MRADQALVKPSDMRNLIAAISKRQFPITRQGIDYTSSAWQNTNECMIRLSEEDLRHKVQLIITDEADNVQTSLLSSGLSTPDHS